jgi:hypothetical protein
MFHHPAHLTWRVPVDHPDGYKQRSCLNTAIRHMTHAKLPGWPMAPKRYSGMMNELFNGMRWVDSCESWIEKRIHGGRHTLR